jgi:hypothetical protein
MFNDWHPRREKVHRSRIDLLDFKALMNLFDRSGYPSGSAALVVSGKLKLFLIIHRLIIFSKKIFQ